MKTVYPVHTLTKDFGPVIFRTTDNILFFYHDYSPMYDMGDERHDLHFFSKEQVNIGDLYFDNHNNVISQAGENTDHETYLYPKVVATTSEKFHRLNKIPLISDEFIREFCHKKGKIDSVDLETKISCINGSHCRYGSMMNSSHPCKKGCKHTADVLKTNDQGEVVIYIEPPIMVDWNKIPLDNLISHLEETFKFDSSGTAKAVHELIQAYRKSQEKKVLSDYALLKIFDENAKKHMIQWDLEAFQKTYPKLLRSIVASMKQL